MKHDQNHQTEVAPAEFSSHAKSGPNVAPLEWTGERMVPEVCDQDTFLEHIYRYKFAMPFIGGKDVLDIACGEGYGSAGFMAGGARSVVGVDIDPDAVEHARLKYDIQARVGSAEAIPSDDNEFDVIVSFETIEHVKSPEKFLDECVRVCRPGGTVVISTPNKCNYLKDALPNEFHVSEMTPEEFSECLSSRFKDVTLFGQCQSWVPWWSPRVLSVAGRSSLLKIPGAYRARSLARRIIAPRLFINSENRMGENPVERMLERDSSVTNILNPYLVRRVNVKTEAPGYLIGVARL